MSVLVFLNQEKLDNSYFKAYYKFYYFILIANLINMTYFTIYYHNKKKKLIGNSGKKGITGKKGERINL